MNKMKCILIRMLAIVVLAGALAGCGIIATEEVAPTTAEGYTALRDPFGDGLKRWSLARPFAARAGISGGTWPADVYVTEDRQSANVYPIAPGKVVKVGAVDSQASWRGQYVVIEHSGRFLLPASDGTHVNTTVADELPTELPVGHNEPILPAEDLFTTDEKIRHDFSGEASYALNEDTVSRIFSVYKNLTALNVRTGTTITDLAEPLGRLNAAPTQLDYRPALELEIRFFGNRDVNSAAYNVVLGPSGDGSFADVAQMLGFGYLEASSVIQANLDEAYYDGVIPGSDLTDGSLPTEADSGINGSSNPDGSNQATEPLETSEPEPTAIPEPVAGTDEEIGRVRNYLLDLNNYQWFSEINSIPVFDTISEISSEWLAERFLWDALRTNEGEPITLTQLEALAQATFNPAIKLDPGADYSRIPLVKYDAASGVFAPEPSGLEGWTNTNDIRLESLTRIGDRFEAVVYELSYRPIHFDTGTRNFGIVSSSGRYVGFFDHDTFDLAAGRNGLVLRYPLSGDNGRLDQYQYNLEMDESGKLRLLGKTLLPGTEAYRDSLPAIGSIKVERGKIVNTGGLRLRIRDGSSMNAAELGYIDEGRPIYVIGPPTNGFLLIFDPAEDHAFTGFASSQYIAID